MADAALDLSKPVDGFVKKERTSPIPSNAGDHSPKYNDSNSRRSSFSSVHSDENESDTSMNSSCLKPVAGPMPTSSRGSPSSKLNYSSGDEEKGSSSSPERHSSSLRPFKSYPLDPFALYNGNSAISMSNPTSPISPVLAASAMLPAMYDGVNAIPSFPMTPLTSHLMQRKRRFDNRADPSIDPKKTKSVPEDKKDDAYWERRRKNNEAAKRSRDTRRCKEEEIAMRAAFLEQENLKLRAQVAILKNETAKLHYMLYNRL